MDKIRGAIFNIISANFPDILLNARVCDIFAGTGAMGTEAISRGAAHATFIETDKIALKFLKENIKGLESRTKLIPYDARRAIDKLADEFDIIFLDPPYNLGLIQLIIDKLANFNILKQSGIVVIEHTKQEKFYLPDKFVIFKQKSYNEKMITILIPKE